MGSLERSKKRIQLWKKALIHFSLCFVMGFFTGFAPTRSSDNAVTYQPIHKPGLLPDPIEPLRRPSEDAAAQFASADTPPSHSTGYRTPLPDTDDDPPEANPQGLLLLITTTRSGDSGKAAALTRLAHTLLLVRPPLLWLVVEPRAEAAATAGMLRGTRLMYRHLTFRENFTDAAAEAHHQRNVALNHIEHHRLNGIVHFAGASNVYDLQFFDEIRRIEVFGTWPVAVVSASRKRVVVEGPVCRDSNVVGWFAKDLSDGATRAVSYGSEPAAVTGAVGAPAPRPPDISASGFAFNSSILWDPERWGRPTSLPDTSQDSFKFAQEVVLEDEAKLKGIPSGCSQIMLWHLHTPKAIPLDFTQDQNRR